MIGPTRVSSHYGLLPEVLRLPHLPSGEESEDEKRAANSRFERRIEEESRKVLPVYNSQGKTVRRDESYDIYGHGAERVEKGQLVDKRV